VSTAATSRLGWYVRRAAQMSPAEMAWRIRDQVSRAAWSPRQVTRDQLMHTLHRYDQDHPGHGRRGPAEGS
jgi:hypothetical protein